MKDDAFEKMELVKPKTLQREDGVEVFIDLVRSKYEPLEYHRVGKVMDDFMYRFERKSDESILDYNTRFDRQVYEAEKMAGELAPIWKAHL